MYCTNCREPNAIINGSFVCLNCPQYLSSDSGLNLNAINPANIIKSVYFICSIVLLFSITNLTINLLSSSTTPPLININNLSNNINLNSGFTTIKNTILQELPSKTPISTPPTTPVSYEHIVVSVSQQHLWAYDGTTQVYSSNVITGASNLGESTPIGTWKIYGKSSNVYLKGPTWDDFVQYWMPFVGPYGLHDASWRDPNQFGIKATKRGMRE